MMRVCGKVACEIEGEKEDMSDTSRKMIRAVVDQVRSKPVGTEEGLVYPSTPLRAVN